MVFPFCYKIYLLKSKGCLASLDYSIPSCFFAFADNLLLTRSYDCVRYFFQSDVFILLISSIHTHLYFATYGAGLNPGRLHISSNSSSVTLNEADVGDWSSPRTQNIFPPIENTRSWSHLTSSVTEVMERQMSWISSIFILTWCTRGWWNWVFSRFNRWR